jgi:DNA primase
MTTLLEKPPLPERSSSDSHPMTERAPSKGEIIADRLHLRKRGDEWFGLCPFACSRVGSLHVNENGRWRCSICNRAGTPYALLESALGLSFPESLTVMHGPIDGVNDELGNRSLRSELLAANAFVAEYYRNVLEHAPEAAEARRIVAERGLTADILRAYGIGYAPASTPGKAEFRKAFSDAGFSRETGMHAGVLIDSVRGVYPFFRARITIPMRSETGDVLGFGGRAILADSRKYVNTAATPVHRKGSSLYGMDKAQESILDSGVAIVVEGYFDCIALQAAGFTNTVAALGTSFTEDQAHAIARIGASVIACFDADGAGEKAAKKSEETAKAVGLRFARAVLPPDMDPDDIIRQGGRDAFARLLDDVSS